jgi:hypothetical protein
MNININKYKGIKLQTLIRNILQYDEIIKETLFFFVISFPIIYFYELQTKIAPVRYPEW